MQFLPISKRLSDLIRWSGVCLFMLEAWVATDAQATSAKIKMTINAHPEHTSISWYDPATKKTSPPTIGGDNTREKWKVYDDDPGKVTLSHDNFFTETLTFYPANIPPKVDACTNDVFLEPQTVVVPIKVIPTPGDSTVDIFDGAKHIYNGDKVSFSRNDKASTNWSFITVTVSRANYATQTIALWEKLNEDEMGKKLVKDFCETGEAGTNLWEIPVELVETARVVTVTFEVNEPRVSVYDDTNVVCKTGPLVKDAASNNVSRVEHVFRFERSSEPGASYKSKKLRLQKADYEYVQPDPNTPSKPCFEATLTAEDAPTRTITARSFEVATILSSPIRTIEIDGIQADFPITDAFSANLSKTPPVSIGTSEIPLELNKTEEIIAGRICSDPNSPEGFCLVVPSFEKSPGSDELVVTRVNLKLRNRPNNPTTVQVLEGIAKNGLPIDPFISGDTLYFSGVYFGKRVIASKSINKPGDPQILVDASSGYLDVEPTVAGEMLAFTRRPVSREATDQSPSVIICKMSQTGIGPQRPIQRAHSPSWNSTGSRLVFVDDNNSLQICNQDGARENRSLSEDDEIPGSPIWSKNGFYIIYMSRRKNGGRWQSDIKAVLADSGDRKSLVENQSFNGFPVLSQDGKAIFFLTNLGARTGGERNLRVMKMELPEKYYLPN